MNVESLHKYLSIVNLSPNVTEVLFSGQPCVTVTENKGAYVWAANPVFAKLTYGANMFVDLPQMGTDSFGTLEEAIADGLLKFEERGSFATMIDLPEDTYTATMVAEAVKAVATDCINESMNRAGNIAEAMPIAESLIDDALSTRVQDITERELSEPEAKKREEIVASLKKDKAFMSKYGKNSAYAIATAKAKESA